MNVEKYDKIKYPFVIKAIYERGIYLLDARNLKTRL